MRAGIPGEGHDATASPGQPEPVHQLHTRTLKRSPRFQKQVCQRTADLLSRWGELPRSVAALPLLCLPGDSFRELMHGDALCRAEQSLTVRALPLQLLQAGLFLLCQCQVSWASRADHPTAPLRRLPLHNTHQLGPVPNPCSKAVYRKLWGLPQGVALRQRDQVPPQTGPCAELGKVVRRYSSPRNGTLTAGM